MEKLLRQEGRAPKGNFLHTRSGTPPEYSGNWLVAASSGAAAFFFAADASVVENQKAKAKARAKKLSLNLNEILAENVGLHPVGYPTSFQLFESALARTASQTF